MANPEHIEILKNGTSAWNQWRKEHPEIWPDLAEANLSGKNMESMLLTKTKLERANLAGANLERARLNGANLIGANFTRAKLTYADLSGALMVGANLSGADMCAANMEKANVMGVIYDRKGKYKGIRLGGVYGSERFQLHARHQSLIEELQSSGPVNRHLCTVWNIMADCGRTPWRWISWSMAAILFHTAMYWWVLGGDSFYISSENPLVFEPWTALYYSIVTFTTLGFGDITPVTFWAMFWVTSEVVAGYIMLGGLISFIYSKLLARG
jgi:uncharacterized protein YjbI with pentapeptide repeats